MTDLIDAPVHGAGLDLAPLQPVAHAPLPRLEPASPPVLDHAPTPGALAPPVAALAPPAQIALTNPPAPAHIAPAPTDALAPSALLPPPALAPPAIANAAPSAVHSPAQPEVHSPANPASALANGPSSVLAPDPAMVPLEASVPAVPALPSPSVFTAPNTAAAAIGANGKGPLDIDLFDIPTASAKKSTGGARRVFGRLLMVGLLGAGGWFGSQHGPALYEQYVSGSETANEPEAPLSFPIQSTALPIVRVAEFTLTNLADAPETTYHVTTDFETNVSRVNVTRPGGPDLEVLTFGNAAFIRRVDARQWYEVDRGHFPLQDRLERADWVRYLDEFIPVAQRGAVTIERSTDSTIAGVPTRHLLLSIDPSMIGSASMPPVDVNSETVPAPDATLAPDPAADALATATSFDGSPDLLPVVGDTQPAPEARPGVAAQVEIWIDADGIVRQISGAPQLGADTITVIATSAEAWVPTYPTPDQVLPLTAAALIDLGL